MTRRLVSTRRQIKPSQQGAYDVAWSRLRVAAASAGAHAWRFRSVDGTTEYIEFLEFPEGKDPRDNADVKMATRGLDQLAKGRSEEWENADQVGD